MRSKRFKPTTVNDRVFDYYCGLGRVREYVQENYSESISLDSAAGIAAMEATYFSAFFHRKVGITFRDWLREVRIAKAIELMKNNDRSISEIAFEVGFADLRTFERAFKKLVNMKPLQFKKSVRP